jgi:hypothetical protein
LFQGGFEIHGIRARPWSPSTSRSFSRLFIRA